MNNSVVISGISIVSPLGLNIRENWQNLLVGKDAFSKIESFDASPFSTSIGAEIKSLIGVEDRYLKIFDTLINELLVDADLKKDDLKKAALLIGSSFIGIEGDKVKKTNSYIKELKKNYGFKNVIVNTNTCAASNFSVNSAYNLVKGGFYDYVICGGIEILTRYLFAGFDSIRSLSKSSPKPFSRDRDGLIPGEGGALLVVENEERLERRNKKGYCKILGFGSSVDNCKVTSMDKNGLGIKKCFEEALSKGCVRTEEI
nr:beta-ketoacyl synthase N-terminal-like domain-containing protein [Spirochaetota bacterium]